MRARMSLHGLAERDLVNVAESVARYLDYLKNAGQAQATINAAKRDMNTFQHWLRYAGREAVAAEALTAQDVTAFYFFLRDCPALGTGRPFKRRVVRGKLTRFQDYARFLLVEGVLARDIGAAIPHFKLAARSGRVLTEAEAAALIEAPDVTRPIGIRDRAMFELTYGCALTWQELAALEPAAVDPAAVTLRTGGRAIPLPSVARAWLGRYLAEVRPRVVMERGSGSRLFLGFLRGEVLTRAAIYARFELMRKRSAVTAAIACEGLRASLVAHLLERGASPDSVLWFAGLTAPPETMNATEAGREVLARHPRHVS